MSKPFINKAIIDTCCGDCVYNVGNKTCICNTVSDYCERCMNADVCLRRNPVKL
jgi:hypothetical protein